MKFLLLAAFVGFASAGPTCDECKTAVADLNTYLVSDLSLAAQIAVLIAADCPNQPDPAACEEGVVKYWPGIAKATYGFFFTQKEPCGEMGLDVCKRDWTCDDCTAAITLLAGIMTQDEYVNEAIAYVQGDGYCKDALCNLPDCENVIAEHLGTALAILSDTIVAQAEGLCQKILGVC